MPPHSFLSKGGGAHDILNLKGLPGKEIPVTAAQNQFTC